MSDTQSEYWFPQSSSSLYSSLPSSKNNSSTTQITTTSNPSKPIKRRSRSSKSTPTTLLNATTTNFRALVQQFTGCHRRKTTVNSLLFGCQKGPVNLDFQLGSVSLQNDQTVINNYGTSFGNFNDQVKIQLQEQQQQQQQIASESIEVSSENWNIQTGSGEIGLMDEFESLMMGDGVDLTDDIASLESVFYQNFDHDHSWNVPNQYPNVSHNISCNF